MKTRTLYLHVGPSKTGTSALQAVLSPDVHPGLIYPRVGLWRDGAHHNLVFNYLGDHHRPELQAADPAVLFRQIGDVSRERAGNLMISSELFAAYRLDMRKFLAELMPFLAPDRWAVEFLFVAREHFERATSCYNQCVKDGYTMERRDPDEYLLHQADLFRYAPMLQLCQEAGPTTVLNYHPGDTLVQRFTKLIGCEPGEVSPKRRNVSLSIKGLIAILAANRIVSSPEERSRCFEALRRMHHFRSRSRSIFSAATIDRVNPIFDEDRRYLLENFGIALPKREDAESQEFSLNERDLNEIARVTHDLGDIGIRIVEQAAQYLVEKRSTPPASIGARLAD